MEWAGTALKRLGTAAVLVLVASVGWVATAMGQATTVTFDAPAPPGSSSSLIEGVFLGIDFGTGLWRWESGYDVDSTNHIYFSSPSGTSRTFQFSPAPRTLTSIAVFTTGPGTLTLSDDQGQTVTRTVSTGSMQSVTTGWTQASTIVTVTSSSGWNLGIDDITYRVAGNGQAGAAGYALRFYGNGVNDIDRVKILIDDPVTTAPGPPADVGATDFTLELWLRALAAENSAPAVACGANNDWIYGNIVVDRDRFNQGRAFGLSIAGGVVVFGVLGEGTGALTICGTSNVADNQWHHIAVQRRRADGWLWLYVDGRLEAQGDGPDGDVSYPDDGVPGLFCGGPCTNSDPYLVLGAEKHDAGPQFSSFAGWLDEIRLSNVLRYATNFPRPAIPFLPDANTVALYHLDEGGGDLITDSSGALGGPSHGVRRYGGTPPGPEWVVSDAPGGSPGDLVAAYSFDEGFGPTVSDASGNGNTGSISGATWTPLGRFGGALAFNGVDAWVTVNDSASLDLSTGMTLAAWVFPTTSPTNWRTVIAKEGPGGLVYFLHASSQPNNQAATGVTIAGTEQQLLGGTTVPVNTWTHLAATYDGTVQRLYVNGVEVASRAQTGAMASTLDALRIGGNSLWGEYFEGFIDEVRIYNRALSAADIQDDMNSPIARGSARRETDVGASS